MPGTPSRILTLGEYLIDLIATDGAPDLRMVETLAVRPGGAPANVAVALQRLGVPAAFAGVVGDDPFGSRLLDLLDREGVDRESVRTAAGVDTTLAFAWKDERGDGHFRLTRMADALLSSEDIDSARIQERCALVVGSVALSAEPSRDAIHYAVTQAREFGIPVCFDVNVRPTLWPDRAAALEACQPVLDRSSVVKLSLDDARYLFGTADDVGDVFARLRPTPAEFVVVTNGARGAWFADRTALETKSMTSVPAFVVESVDPTGAGDAFTSAILTRLVQGDWSGLDEDDMRFAAAAGALTTTRHGAIEALPTAVDVDRFLALQAPFTRS